MCNYNLCDGSGFMKIPGSGNMMFCMCEKERVARRFYKSAGAPIKNMRLPRDWEEDPIIETDKGNMVLGKETFSKLVQRIDKFISENKRIILSGDHGRGKTQFACSLMLYGLLNKFETKTMFINAQTITDDIYNSDVKKDLIKRAKKAQILIIDDLGAEIIRETRKTEDIVGFWNGLIREFNGLLIVTTNREPEKQFLMNLYGENSERMLTSLFDNCKKYYFFGDDFTESNNKDDDLD